MAKTPPETVRRATAEMRKLANSGFPKTCLPLVADTWDAVADDMETLHATEQPHGVTDWSGQTHAAWTAVLTAARAYLGES